MSLTRRYRAHLSLIVILGLVGGIVGSFVVTPRPLPIGDGFVYPAEARVYGATLGQWSARYWQWAVRSPVGSNAGHDPTGARCSAGQDGPVFFVPSNFPPCVVPAGKIIYVPIVAAECSTAEVPPFSGGTEGELRACAGGEVDRYAAIIVRIDGIPVEDVYAYRASSPVFRMELPANNVLGGTPGSALAVADGYQVLLAPLPPGSHEITVHVELTDGLALPDKVMTLTVV